MNPLLEYKNQVATWNLESITSKATFLFFDNLLDALADDYFYGNTDAKFTEDKNLEPKWVVATPNWVL